MPKEIILTKEGLEKLKGELQELKEKDRKEVIERIKTAKEFGDLSENAEYEEAKNAQSFVEGRIQELEDMIRRARIITTTAHTGGEIALGSQVQVEVEGQSEEYTIVGPTESDPSGGKISIESPLGKAMLGHRTGDLVKITAPGGPLAYKVKKVW